MRSPWPTRLRPSRPALFGFAAALMLAAALPLTTTLTLATALTDAAAAPVAAAPAPTAPAKTAPAPPTPAIDVTFDSETLAGLTPRCIGPAAMAGRIAAIDAVHGEKFTIYVGAASGGVWKSVDGGVTFKPVFDKYCQSVGAIAIDPTDPAIVWVGTGESWTRNSVSIGDGIYRSADGGESWQNLGLHDSERIARIVVDPRNHDTVYVAATGHLWNDNDERGVYKTQDGGKSWSRVLYVDAKTGCADIAIDPADPNTLYAGMWQFRRRPAFFTSGGPGSGLYKTADGGRTWTRLTKGLPAGELGRIGIAVAPAKPEVVYAVVEAKRPDSGLYRSDDRGASWTKSSTSGNVVVRPFYFAHIVPDPKDPQRIYKPGGSLTVTEDGGISFGSPFLGQGVHGDLHALWINPHDPQEMVVGTDGGVYISLDRANHWRLVGTLPVSQFYHVSLDMEWPYNVYGGLQDNGTWSGPSRRTATDIGNRHWRSLGGGDGFCAFVDPTDPDLVYWEYQGGNVARVCKSTNESKEIQPLPGVGDPEYRFNWNTPLHLSPRGDGTLYIGAQFLFRTRDRGENWEKISPDLTTNDPAQQRQAESGGLTVDNSGAENHCTIYAICESPLNAQLIWVGTDDGNLQITRDGGKSWTNIVKNVPGLPSGTWVSSVQASRFDEGTAYATFDGHMTGDMKTYVYRTADCGRTWAPLATDALHGYAHVIKEDLVERRLLFLGTELGLFISPDGGTRWAQLKSDFPNVAVRDIAIHQRDHDLVLATHGRGVWIIDDLTPLRALTPEVLAQDAALLPSRPSEMVIPASEQRFDADDQYAAPSPEGNATIAYYLKKRHMFGELKLEIYDAKDSLISSLPGGKRRGLNRIGWPMRLRPPKVPRADTLVPQAFSFVGPRVPEGTYKVKLVKGDASLISTVALVADPRSQHSVADRALQQQTAMRLYRMLERLAWTVESIVGVQDQAKSRAGSLKKGDALAKRLITLNDTIEALRKDLVATQAGGMITGERKLRERLGSLYGAINGNDGRPTGSQLSYTAVLGQKVDQAVARWDALIQHDVAPANDALGRKKMDPLKVLTREEWEKQKESVK